MEENDGVIVVDDTTSDELQAGVVNSNKIVEDSEVEIVDDDKKVGK